MEKEPRIEEPKNPLEEVREKFGTLLSESATSVFHKDYREKGDRIVLCTESEGIRGESGKAPIDIALTPEAAKRLKDSLEASLQNWEKTKEK